MPDCLKAEACRTLISGVMSLHSPSFHSLDLHTSWASTLLKPSSLLMCGASISAADSSCMHAQVGLPRAVRDTAMTTLGTATAAGAASTAISQHPSAHHQVGCHTGTPELNPFHLPWMISARRLPIMQP